MEGLNVEFPDDIVGSKYSKRRNNLWWTIYILDQRISSAVGGPMTIPDDFITATLCSANESPQRDALLSLQVQVSRLIYRVLSSKYLASLDN